MLHGRRTRVVGQLHTSWRWLAAALIAVVMLAAAPGVLASAQTRIGINGGRPSEWPILSTVLAAQGLTQESWLSFASQVGENWLPGTTPVPLNYPGQLGVVSGPNALTVDQSTAVGQRLLHALILSELAKGQPVAVAGLSEGTLVIERELAYLATLSPEDAPSRDALTFYVFGDMLRGLGQMYLQGWTIPFVGQTFGPVPETPYDMVVVNEQWDGWANPPDRPWNLLAVVNAVMGALLTINGSNDHSQTSLDSLSDAVKVSETTNTLGGTTTTYLVPRQQLPLTRPLRQLGIPGWVVDEIDKLLMPIIRTGYSTLTPNLGPYVDRGQLVWNSPAPPPVVPVTTTQEVAVTSLAAVPKGVETSPEPVATAVSGAARSAPEKAAAIRTDDSDDVAVVATNDPVSTEAPQVDSTDADESAPKETTVPETPDVVTKVVPTQKVRTTPVREAPTTSAGVDDEEKPSVAEKTGADASPRAESAASVG